MAITVTDEQVRSSIRSILENASGASVRVVPRWLLDFNQQDWSAIVRALTEDGTTNGWLITRSKARSRRIAPMQWERYWTYALWYFKSYEQGNASSNSEKQVNAIIEAVTQAFEDSDQLGFTGDEIDYHQGFNAESIDIVDNQMHVVIGELTVNITSQ